MKKWSTKMLVEAGIMIALSVLLSRIKVYEAPQGGSVTAGSMIPILLFAMRWGLGPGITAGATFGLIKLILGGWIFSPTQAILEYPIAFGFLGLAGIFSNSIENTKGGNYFKIVLSIFLAIAGRFICHLLAGVIFFSEYAGTQNPWIYSFIYQSSYLVPEFIVSAIILSFIWKPISRIEK
ncbi:Proton-coupled thiamine transporter YuaJ [[Clostridium] ultunense Esp]|uniref:Proton-coupled thiamine transporter YuaJ n=1 Tax=[Clostridium] ultunense Esp TaxID=1288971 RepID=M1ZKH1_9FIRM|nr:energy-coupled thiamine transporter ThiT [Schnuerera ultunensis]CCQ95442.1 Proton-coupled thiamine transporter YuaJ [[Clostridium] ultunense Esp]SHD76959.1 Proton-coupled thiamine transporter YuaJ [[Clostridium] ultunense Esp]